nr:uncharacterized mitochondrial protein AtMg00810-like [Tanacetum cinerariifolium]
MMEKSKLDEDPQGKAVDPTCYRGMIGTLMHLTSSRPDLVFVVCICSWYQENPTEKHLHAVKQIFRYLRGTISMGLWYSKNSCIALTAFADADNAGCQDTKKSTSRSMQLLSDRLKFWYTIKKVKDSKSYEFLLANKKCIVNAEVFRKVLDICPRVKDQEFTEVQDDDATLTFLIDLGYKVPLHKYTNMYVDHMHQPWRTLGAIFTEVQDDDATLTFLIDLGYKGPLHKYTNILKFVKIGEDYKEYGLPIPNMMLNDKIKQSESYQMFLKYSTGPLKKSRGKGSQEKKTVKTLVADVNVSEESDSKPARKIIASRRMVKKKVTILQLTTLFLIQMSL